MTFRNELFVPGLKDVQIKALTRINDDGQGEYGYEVRHDVML
jgi:hypothetical protein